MRDRDGGGFDPRRITRPCSGLLVYYFVICLFTGPVLVLAFPPLLFKYLTLSYRFDESGVAMRWGVLFRREIYLSYRRIQDIHLTRNIAQRWMGLASVALQTASGSAAPEMTIEGIRQYEALRDYLYAEMRGARGETVVGVRSDGDGDEALALLTEIRDLLRALRSRGAAP